MRPALNKVKRFFASLRNLAPCDNAVVMELIDLRARMGLSQKQLADAVGVDQATISRIEKGKPVRLSKVVYLAALAVHHKLA
jgi:DNA-binding XRE family transcriptional regulator